MVEEALSRLRTTLTLALMMRFIRSELCTLLFVKRWMT